MSVTTLSQEEYNSLLSYLNGNFTLTAFGDARHFLEIQIELTVKGFTLSQETYIEHGFIQQKEKSDQLTSKDKYQSLVGDLLYVAVNGGLSNSGI